LLPARQVSSESARFWFSGQLAQGFSFGSAWSIVGDTVNRKWDCYALSCGGDKDHSVQLGELTMSAGTGGDYIVDLQVENGDALADDAPLAVLRFAGDDHVMFAATPDQEAVWRPHGLGVGTRWQASARSQFTVAEGERPVLLRHPDLADQVELRVETIGAVRATPPRDWALPLWLLATAAAVTVIELASGTWRSGVSVLPWLVLVIGSLIARAPVEPLRLIGERLAADLALAALISAWLPAASVSWACLMASRVQKLSDL